MSPGGEIKEDHFYEREPSCDEPMGKNLKMWKIGKMKKMGYLCQTSSKYEFNTPDIVKLYSGPVLLSSIFDFWQSFPSEIFFLVFAQILLKNLVKYALFGQ